MGYLGGNNNRDLADQAARRGFQQDQNQNVPADPQAPIAPNQVPTNDRLGLLGEIGGLILPFFYSLLPTWIPQGAPQPQPNIQVEQPAMNVH